MELSSLFLVSIAIAAGSKMAALNIGATCSFERLQGQQNSFKILKEIKAIVKLYYLTYHLPLIQIPHSYTLYNCV